MTKRHIQVKIIGTIDGSSPSGRNQIAARLPQGMCSLDEQAMYACKLEGGGTLGITFDRIVVYGSTQQFAGGPETNPSYSPADYGDVLLSTPWRAGISWFMRLGNRSRLSKSNLPPALVIYGHDIVITADLAPSVNPLDINAALSLHAARKG